MNQTITIVDYGMGNLRSVQKAFEHQGYSAQVTNRPEAVAAAAKLVLPGVGAFGDAMANLREHALIEPIRDYLNRGRPFLGICLGLQMLFQESHEDGVHQGLGIFPGRVERFVFTNPADVGRKIPHMGWNEVKKSRPAPILCDFADEAFFYFVHSYHVVPEAAGLATAMTDYGYLFTSMIWHEHIYATQFHPEKSQAAGLALIRRFAEL